MVFFKYGFVFLVGAGFGAALAHRGQHHRHGHCWRRHWGGDRWHEQDPAPASYDDYEGERRGYYGRPDTADRDTEEREYRRSVKKSKKPAAAAADAAAVTCDY
ncbi:hypothetical protein BS78_07G048700 [Paspalum vaginatum]|nr:hypothetical protein BS78_07G048700 [Paspalum vaginatum]